MNKKEIIEYYRQHYSIFNDYYARIDQPIKPLVNYMRKLGFYTFASCSSHLYNWEGKSIDNCYAYVGFFYEDKDYNKIITLKNHKFPKSKFYNSYFDIDKSKNKVCFYIIFNTRNNRTRYLKSIYKSLGIEVNYRLKLEFERENFKSTKNPNFTVFKNFNFETLQVCKYFKERSDTNVK